MVIKLPRWFQILPMSENHCLRLRGNLFRHYRMKGWNIKIPLSEQAVWPYYFTFIRKFREGNFTGPLGIELLILSCGVMMQLQTFQTKPFRCEQYSVALSYSGNFYPNNPWKSPYRTHYEICPRYKNQGDAMMSHVWQRAQDTSHGLNTPRA